MYSCFSFIIINGIQIHTQWHTVGSFSGVRGWLSIVLRRWPQRGEGGGKKRAGCRYHPRASTASDDHFFFKQSVFDRFVYLSVKI